MTNPIHFIIQKLALFFLENLTYSSKHWLVQTITQLHSILLSCFSTLFLDLLKESLSELSPEKRKESLSGLLVALCELGLTHSLTDIEESKHTNLIGHIVTQVKTT